MLVIRVVISKVQVRVCAAVHVFSTKENYAVAMNKFAHSFSALVIASLLTTIGASAAWARPPGLALRFPYFSAATPRKSSIYVAHNRPSRRHHTPRRYVMLDQGF